MLDSAVEIKFGAAPLVTAGNDSAIQVLALDQHENIDKTATPAVVGRFRDETVICAMVQGSCLLPLSSTLAGLHNVTVEGASTTGISLPLPEPVQVVPGAPHQLKISSEPTSVDVVSQVSVTVHDRFGNFQPSVRAFEVNFTSNISANVLTQQVVVDNGTGVVNLSSQTAETASCFIAAETFGGLNISSRHNHVFQAGSATAIEMVIVNQSVTVDNAAQVNLVARDQYGNVAKSFAGNTTMALNGSGIGSSTFSYFSGRAVRYVRNTRVETVAVQVTGNQSGLSYPQTGTVSFASGKGVAVYFQSLQMQSVDDPINISVWIVDQFGNPAATSSAVFPVQVQGPEFSNTTISVTVANGQGQLSVTTSVPQVLQVSCPVQFDSTIDISYIGSISVFAGKQYFRSASVRGPDVLCLLQEVRRHLDSSLFPRLSQLETTPASVCKLKISLETRLETTAEPRHSSPRLDHRSCSNLSQAAALPVSKPPWLNSATSPLLVPSSFQMQA